MGVEHSSVRRILCAILSTVPLVVASPPSEASAAWVGQSSMLGGTARYDSGEWIWQDFVYDDYGADTEPAGASQRVSLAATAGDFRYSSDPAYAGNAADILEVRARAEGDDLRLRVKMSTLVHPGSTVIGVGIGHGGTGEARPWPFEAGVRSAWDAFATAYGGVAIVGPDKLPTEVDLDANTVELAVPGVLAGAASVDLVVGAGLWGAGGWLAGTPGNAAATSGYTTGGLTDVRVFDLAFNSNEAEPEGGNWREDFQADALASGDVSAFSRPVDVAALRAGRTDPPIAAPGFYDRIFRSRQDLGEGVGGGFPQYRGRFQTYGLWIPQGYDPARPAPLALVLHSLSVHHNQYAGSRVYRQLGDELGALAITPLARGPDGWYWDEGLVDTLEAWKDVRDNYSVDAERTYSTGYSMGGYATYRLATLMPDRFAGAVSWVGPPAHQLWAYPADPMPNDSRRGPGNTWFQLENTEYVPFMVVHGTNDELVPVAGVTHQAGRLYELGYEHRYKLHPGQDHLSFAVIDEWTRERDWLRGRSRTVNPGHVVFKVRPASWATPADTAAERDTILGHLEALGANLDSTYWVSEVRVAGSGDVTGVVNLISEGIAARQPAWSDVLSVELMPNTPHLNRGLDRRFDPVPVANVLRGRLSGVSEATVDLARAGLGLDTVVDVDSDRPAVLHLVHGAALRDVRVG